MVSSSTRRNATGAVIGLLISTGLVGACVDRHSTASTDGEPTVETTPGGSSAAAADSAATDSTGSAAPRSRINVIFVVDNAFNTDEPQERLAQGMSAFVEGLGGVDVRIAFTTTDHGHPHCEGPAKHGAFVLSTCRSRLHEFMFNSPVLWDPIHVCTNHCAIEADDSLSPADPYPTLPTHTTIDGSLRARPWLERSDGAWNLPDGVAVEDALGCFAPQGLLACVYVQPLEAMVAALDRATSPDDDAYGFADEGVTAVVLVTPKADCSYNPSAEHIFSPEGSRVFLPPESDAPNFGVCWNAGVVCTGLTDGVYDQCLATNRDPDTGAALPVADEASAALHPISRYIARLGPEIRAYGIVGVPEGYPNTPIQYRIRCNPSREECSATPGQAKCGLLLDGKCIATSRLTVLRPVPGGHRSKNPNDAQSVS